MVKKSIKITICLFIICGVIYPLIVTGISQIIFNNKANGSLITVNEKIVGSELIGQNFTDNKYMVGRPSSVKYNTYTIEEAASREKQSTKSGSENYGPTNEELIKRVDQGINNFLKDNPTVKKEDIQADLLTSSGSGLDPHITVESANIQIPRLIKNTGLTEEFFKESIKKNTTSKFLGVLGEESVNVLGVNIDIYKALKK